MKRYLIITLTLAAVLASSCGRSSKSSEMVKQEIYGTYQGKEAYLLTLTNKAGNVLKLSSFGAKSIWIEVPDKNGVKENIAFGYDTFDGTVNGDPYFGSIVGRYANRIGNAKFTLDSITYNLPANDGPNQLHGGAGGWHSVVWSTEIVKDSEYPSVKFTYVSPDMEMGFPGAVNASVTYTWTDKNEIIMDYMAITDKKTVVNLTNHAYFNLHGAGNGDILDHVVTLKGSAFLPVDSVMIPTGEIRQVAGTPFDFTTPHTIGARIGENYDQLILGKGYDHNYILDNKEEVDVEVYEPVSGRVLEVITDLPGMQFYSGNFLDGTQKGWGGKTFIYRSGFCLESGKYPDSPNKPGFPSTVLNPGETYSTRTIYRFSVR
jgi:aldose 1-epimerase